MNLKADVFDYTDYKRFLIDRLNFEDMGRGARSRLARNLGCQTTFVSQILNGHVHFSLEHAVLINEFFKHDADQSHFFMLLIQAGRAGSIKLNRYYREQLTHIIEKRKIISQRVGETQELSDANQQLYYSSWHYSAIHILTTIPEFQNMTRLANKLRLSEEQVTECLSYLKSVGLVQEMKGRWISYPSRIHLSKESPMISRHHTNWRLRSIQSIEEKKKSNLHFSGVWSFAEADVDKLTNLFLELIEKSEPILRASADEVAFGFGLDFYRLT